MGCEDIYIKQIENGIRSLKFGTKKANELKLTQHFERLKTLNEGMYDDLMERYKEASKINKEKFA